MKPSRSSDDRRTFLRPLEEAWSFIHKGTFEDSLFLTIAANIWRSPISTEVLSQSNTSYTIALFFPFYLTVIIIFFILIVPFIYFE